MINSEGVIATSQVELYWRLDATCLNTAGQRSSVSLKTHLNHALYRPQTNKHLRAGSSSTGLSCCRKASSSGIRESRLLPCDQPRKTGMPADRRVRALRPLGRNSSMHHHTLRTMNTVQPCGRPSLRSSRSRALRGIQVSRRVILPAS